MCSLRPDGTQWRRGLVAGRRSSVTARPSTNGTILSGGTGVPADPAEAALDDEAAEQGVSAAYERSVPCTRKSWARRRISRAQPTGFSVPSCRAMSTLYHLNGTDRRLGMPRIHALRARSTANREAWERCRRPTAGHPPPPARTNRTTQLRSLVCAGGRPRCGRGTLQPSFLHLRGLGVSKTAARPAAIGERRGIDGGGRAGTVRATTRAPTCPRIQLQPHAGYFALRKWAAPMRYDCWWQWSTGMIRRRRSRWSRYSSAALRRATRIPGDLALWLLEGNTSPATNCWPIAGSSAPAAMRLRSRAWAMYGHRHRRQSRSGWCGGVV